MKLKKTIALLSALCLLLTALLLTPALGAYTDQDTIAQEEAVSALTKLGIIEGKDDGSFDPQGTLTRAEAAVLIVRILTEPDRLQGPVLSPSYTDTIGHWAEYPIEYVGAMEIAVGRGDGSFGPDAPVTGSELAKMLLTALGYEARREGMTGPEWRAAVDVLAIFNGLYEGVSLDTAAPIAREDAARMIYNALTIPMVSYDVKLIAVSGPFQGEYVLKIKDPVETLLERFPAGAAVIP